MSPGVANLFELLKACGKTELAAELLGEYQKGNLQYRVLKEVVGDALVELTSQLKTRRDEIASETANVNAKVREMSDKARGLARDTLTEVRRLIGLPPR
jgi:tryptophanyl-tRNA synthetase